VTSENQVDKDFVLVSIDDARTFGGAQVALAWAIRAVVRETSWRVVCVCLPRLRQMIEDFAGSTTRIEFIECPSSLPLNIFSFPLRMMSFLKLLRPLRRRGVGAWWVNLSGIEFGLASVFVLKLLGEEPRAWLHNPQRFSILYRGHPRIRRVLGRIRDKIAEWLLFRLYASIATPSQASARLLQERIGTGTPPGICHLYPTASLECKHLDRSTFPEADNTPEICMCMVGRVEYSTKNNELALFLLNQLVEEGRAATLAIIGDGPDVTRLQSAARDLGIAERVRITGWARNPWSYVPSNSIVVIPSFCETFCLTALEAMLHGIPIVTSPIPAFLEWIPQCLIADDFTPRAFVERIHEVRRLSREKMLDLYASCLAKFSERNFVTALSRQLGATSADDDRLDCKNTAQADSRKGH